MLPIILGSSSVFRQRVLTSNGFEFTTMSPDIDEKSCGLEFRSANDARNLVLAISKAKSTALALQIKERRIFQKGCILITCDQVVVCDGIIREKPTSAGECKRYLYSYCKLSKPAETWSAVCVLNTATGCQSLGVDVAKQFFLDIPESSIEDIISEGTIMHCCGGFMVDHRKHYKFMLDLFLPYLGKRIGTEDSIVGMPVDLLRKLLSDVM